MRINKHDTNGTKPLLGKGELGYDDYTAGGDTGRVYVGTSAENIPLAKRLEANIMTKVQFNALAEERKANRAGSGFDEWGKHSSSPVVTPINNGMHAWTGASNFFFMSEYNSNLGVSKTLNPYSCVNGVLSKISSVAGSTSNIITLPSAPTIYPYDTVLTAEQIASGVIKHADASNSGLIVNGKFDTDTSGWTNSLNATLSIDTNKLKITLSSFGSARQTINTVVGKKYVIEADIVSGTATTRLIVYSSSGVLVYGVANILGRNILEFTATTTTSTIYIDSATLGVILVDNIAVYPADAISRSDLVFLESWHEDVSEKNFVYPLGNVQYLGGNADGLTGIANGAFTGFETYSLFGNWQTPSTLIGKGYVWSSLTEAQKKAFISNPDNNCYLDGDKVIQVRYRVRVVQGWGDAWANTDTESGDSLYYGSTTYLGAKGKDVSIASDLQLASANNFYNSGFVNIIERGIFVAYSSTRGYERKCYALPIALVHRRNQGMYHNVYNPNGTKVASDGLDCFTTTISFNSAMDCFDPAKLLTASGYIGTVRGRPDGLFYDQVHEGDILDLRNSSKKVEDYNRLISREFNKLVAGTTRGFEGEKYTEITTQTTTGTVATVQVKDGTRYKIGDVIYIYDLTASSVKGRFVVISISSNTLTVDTAFAKLANSYMISGASSTRTKSNTLLACDVIGNPSNYPSVWKTNEVTFTTLHTAEDGTSLLPDGTRGTFKLSRKSKVDLFQVLKSTDGGTTWTALTYTTHYIFIPSTNVLSLVTAPATTDLIMVYYQTHTSMAVPVANSEVLEIGEVIANAFSGNSHMVATLIGKIPIAPYAGATKSTEKVGHVFGYASTSGFAFIEDPSSGQRVSHNPISLADGNPAVKVFPYLTRLNGKAYLNLVFKEMKYNGTSWGDNDKFNIVNNVSTTTDNNAQTVLIGQKTVELPYFIAGDE